MKKILLSMTIGLLGFAASQVHALTLTSGDILNITGLANFGTGSSGSDQIVYSNPTAAGATGGFFNEYIIGEEKVVSISTMNLTHISDNTYSVATTNPFITFTNGVSFKVDFPFNVTRLGNTNTGFTYNFGDPFTGSFVNASGDIYAEGIFSAQTYVGFDGSFSMTLQSVESQSTPTPDESSTIALLGLGLVTLGAISRRRK